MSEHDHDEELETEQTPAPDEAEQAEAEEAESDETLAPPDSDEPGPDDDAAAETPAPDETPDTPPAGIGEAEIERNSKAMNRAAEAYVKKAVATLGDDLGGLQRCPLCAEGWPGLRLPVMPEQSFLAATRVAIGLEPGDNLPKDNYSRVCDACDGWGYTDSGSKVPGQAKLTCYDCGGKGWKPVGDERSSGGVTVPNGTNVVPMPVLQDHPSNDPPEVQQLRELGYVVVAPIAPIKVPS